MEWSSLKGRGPRWFIVRKTTCFTKTPLVYVTASGTVIVVNRSQTGSRSPRVSPHSCFVGGVKFPQGEGSAVIHRKKNDLLYKNATRLRHSLWHGDCRKQVANRLKIPQGLSTLLFRRWRWSSLKGRGPRWFTVMRTSCFTKTHTLCHSLWQRDFIRKQVVNRLKIPQGLSTLLFRRWSEVPSRGGVRGDSPQSQRPALHWRLVYVMLDLWRSVKN